MTRKFSDKIIRVPYGAYAGKTAQFESDLGFLKSRSKQPVVVKATERKPIVVGPELTVKSGLVIFVA